MDMWDVNSACQYGKGRTGIASKITEEAAFNLLNRMQNLRHCTKHNCHYSRSLGLISHNSKAAQAGLVQSWPTTTLTDHPSGYLADDAEVDRKNWVCRWVAPYRICLLQAKDRPKRWALSATAYPVVFPLITRNGTPA